MKGITKHKQRKKQQIGTLEGLPSKICFQTGAWTCTWHPNTHVPMYYISLPCNAVAAGMHKHSWKRHGRFGQRELIACFINILLKKKTKKPATKKNKQKNLNKQTTKQNKKNYQPITHKNTTTTNKKKKRNREIPVWEKFHESQLNNFHAFTQQYQLQVLVATDRTLMDQAAMTFFGNKSLNAWSRHLSTKSLQKNLTFNWLTVQCLCTQTRKQLKRNLSF